VNVSSEQKQLIASVENLSVGTYVVKWHNNYSLMNPKNIRFSYSVCNKYDLLLKAIKQEQDL